jgi:phosphoserine phosphatase RsbU/P
VSSEAELMAAEQIQQYLLPHAPPDLPGFDVAGSMHPADFAAGDSFDYLVMSDRSIGVVVGDVAGHGFSSALLMASTHAYLRSLRRTNSDPGELLTRTNRLLAGEIEGLTLCHDVLRAIGTWKADADYVNAGHPTGYVLDSVRGGFGPSWPA